MVSPEPPLDPTPLPPWLRAALEAPRLERRGWQRGAAPAYIGLFLWVVYFDQFPRETAAYGGVAWSALGALVGGLLAVVLLYRVPARWGFATGQTLPILATSTFGVRGATLVPGLLLTWTHPVWLAAAAYVAADLCLRGLVLLQWLDTKALTDLAVGRASVRSPLFVVTALAWCLAAGLTGKYLVRVIAALMKVFPMFTALLLGLAAARAFGGLTEFRPVPLLVGGTVVSEMLAGQTALLVAVQMVLGFFASAGLSSADWGAACLTRGDVRRTGLVGVGFASSVVAVLAVLTVAGCAATPFDTGQAAGAERFTFHAALPALFGARIGGAMMLAFGLAALAPACYAAHVFGTRMHEIRPKRSRTRWTLVAIGIACVLVVLNAPAHLLPLFSVVGGLLTPVSGALAADSYRAGGVWPGPRRGFNRAGIVAVLLGMAVGLAPVVANVVWAGSPLARLQPATLYGFLAAFIAYLALAKAGLEPPPEEGLRGLTVGPLTVPASPAPAA